MIALAPVGAFALAFGLMGSGVWLIMLGQRAGEPRWAVRLSWLLGVELSLAGFGVLTVLAHAALVYASAR